MATRQQRYAKGTGVSISRSREQIEAELRRMGATKRAFYEDDDGSAAIIFELAPRRYRIILPLPDPNDNAYHMTTGGNQFATYDRRRSKEQAFAFWEQDVKERWRALAEFVKAMRIAKDAGIIRLEEVLMANTLLPSGVSVGEWMEPQITRSYQTGQMPPMLPMLEPPRNAPQSGGRITITEHEAS